MPDPFVTDYDLGARRVVRPSGRSFDLVVTPRYEERYVRQRYESLSADLLVNLLHRRRLFVDVGAHCGFYTLLAATCHASVHVVALEPVAESHELLLEGVRRNRVEPQVETHRIAASEREGSAQFCISEASDNCGFYPYPGTKTLARPTVRTSTLDRLLSGAEGAETAVVKIDTEGHELAVLAGMRDLLAAASDLRLFVELNPTMQRLAGHDPAELVAHLQSCGFAIFLIDDGLRRFVRLTRPEDWRNACAPDGYTNLYCVPRQRALATAMFSHSIGLQGAERILLGNVTALVQDQGAVCTVVLPGEGPLRDRLEAAGAATITAALPWWCDFTKVPEPTATERLSKGVEILLHEVVPSLASAAPDVIETMTLVAPWGALAAAALDRPHVWSVCEYGERDHHLRFFWPLALVLEAIRNSSDLVLTLSSALHEELFPDLGEDRCRTIGPWIPDPHLAPVALRGATSTHRRLGVFATLSEGKDQATAVRALARLANRGHDVELVLAGHANTEYLDHLMGLIEELGLGQRVHAPGFVEDPSNEMAEMDIVVSTAPHEAFGLTALEASLLERPFVCARGSGPTEFLRDGEEASWFEPGDAEDLAAKLELLLTRPDVARRQAVSARSAVSARFSREAISKQRLEMLIGLRNRHRADSGRPLSGLMGKAMTILESERARLEQERVDRVHDLAMAESQRDELRRALAAVAADQAAERRRWEADRAALASGRMALAKELASSARAQETLRRDLTSLACEAAAWRDSDAASRQSLATLRDEHQWMVESATWRWRSRFLKIPGLLPMYRRCRALLRGRGTTAP